MYCSYLERVIKGIRKMCTYRHIWHDRIKRLLMVLAKLVVSPNSCARRLKS